MSGGGQTALARARLVDGNPPRLDDVRVIFQQDGPPSSGNHFGCRIVQARDGNLFLTTGDHFRYRDEAQNLGNHLGKVIRVTPDGRVPPDNPFVKRAGAKPEIWSYGHRNMQGAALNPQSGKLWTHEHGARGGDEINIPEAGKNYGWPVITWGIDYSGAKIGVGTQRDGMEQPVKYWVPSIAPSGMAFYTGDLFPNWRGNLFVGALAGQMLVRLDDQRREGRQRGTAAAKSARAHPRRAAGPRRRALSRDRQFQRPHPAGVAGEVALAWLRLQRAISAIRVANPGISVCRAPLSRGQRRNELIDRNRTRSP